MTPHTHGGTDAPECTTCSDMQPKEKKMTLKIEQAERKPFLVDYVLVTEENMEEAAKWCGGRIRTSRHDNVSVRYIKVEVTRPANPRQTKALAGDRILHTSSGFRVYMDIPFQKSFREPEVHANLEEIIEVAPEEASV